MDIPKQLTVPPMPKKMDRNANNRKYTIYLKNGMYFIIIGCGSWRDDEYTEFYRETDEKEIAARFEHNALAGFLVEEVQNDK